MYARAGGRRYYGNHLQKREIGPRCSGLVVNCFGETLNWMLPKRLI